MWSQLKQETARNEIQALSLEQMKASVIFQIACEIIDKTERLTRDVPVSDAITLARAAFAEVHPRIVDIYEPAGPDDEQRLGEEISNRINSTEFWQQHVGKTLDDYDMSRPEEGADDTPKSNEITHLREYKEELQEWCDWTAKALQKKFNFNIHSTPKLLCQMRIFAGEVLDRKRAGERLGATERTLYTDYVLEVFLNYLFQSEGKLDELYQSKDKEIAEWKEREPILLDRHYRGKLSAHIQVNEIAQRREKEL